MSFVCQAYYSYLFLTNTSHAKCTRFKHLRARSRDADFYEVGSPLREAFVHEVREVTERWMSEIIPQSHATLLLQCYVNTGSRGAGGVGLRGGTDSSVTNLVFMRGQGRKVIQLPPHPSLWVGVNYRSMLSGKGIQRQRVAQ